MNFSETPEFQKDVKRLAKKWRSIPDDVEAVKPYLLPLYELRADDVEVSIYRREFFNGKRAAIIKTTSTTEVIKMRLDVSALNGSDKVRIIFVAVKTDCTIRFVEMYAKNEKAREDAKRIKKYMS